MSARRLWILNQSAEFLAGYDAACANEPDDKHQSVDWRRGYLAALEDIECGE